VVTLLTVGNPWFAHQPPPPALSPAEAGLPPAGRGPAPAAGVALPRGAGRPLPRV